MAVDQQVLRALDRVDAFDQDTTSPVFDTGDLALIAGTPQAIAGLVAIARDPGAPLARRYAAVEAIGQAGATDALTRDGADAGEVAAMLASAMRRDQVHNRWGVPGQFVGGTGALMLALGPAAIDALRPLFSDKQPLNFVGGQAPTLQSAHGYRICDLAGYLVATARGVPWRDDPDPAVRDRTIGDLGR